MYPLCRFESARDHLRRREQSPCSAMRSLRRRHRPRDRPEPPTPPSSLPEPNSNAYLRKRSVEEESSHDGVALTGMFGLSGFLVCFVYLVDLVH